MEADLASRTLKLRNHLCGRVKYGVADQAAFNTLELLIHVVFPEHHNLVHRAILATQECRDREQPFVELIVTHPDLAKNKGVILNSRSALKDLKASLSYLTGGLDAQHDFLFSFCVIRVIDRATTGHHNSNLY